MNKDRRKWREQKYGDSLTERLKKQADSKTRSTHHFFGRSLYYEPSLEKIIYKLSLNSRQYGVLGTGTWAKMGSWVPTLQRPFFKKHYLTPAEATLMRLKGHDIEKAIL